jgi:GNAT superfamily N-acetyltransferase
MQIREMNLKELYEIYELVKQIHKDLSYESFEDLIYEMQRMDYKMFGVLERGELFCFAGVVLQTSFLYKRHLLIIDFVTDEPWRFMGYANMMLSFLEDYAKSAMCENIVAQSLLGYEDGEKFYEKKGFAKESFTFCKLL